VVVNLLEESRSVREMENAAKSGQIIPFSVTSAGRGIGPATGELAAIGALPVIHSHPRDSDEVLSPFVIRGSRGKGHLIGLQKIWDRVRAKAGLQDARLHDLRHSYASMAIANGAGLAEVKELLGHRDIATTQRYVHLYTDKIRESVALVEAGILGTLDEDLRSSVA
jgi:hypothetical protein